MLKRVAATAYHAGERILGNNDGQPRLFLQQAVEVSQERSAPCQRNALVGNIRAEFRWRVLQS